jgi:inorganic pyrophosphatase
MMDLTRLPTLDENGSFLVVIESPKGSKIKYKYNEKLKVFSLSRPLSMGIEYPHNWGFIPGTQMEDGDPVDAMVLFDEVLLQGTVIPCRVIGVLKLEQNRKNKPGRERNDRIIAIPEAARRFKRINRIQNLSQKIKEELEEFFKAAALFQNKNIKFLGWGNKKEAEKLIHKSIIED